MGYLVRSWNVFHGRSESADRHAHLEEVVALATADRPEIVCLQEVPVWGLAQLEIWSGMTAIGDVTRRAFPLPTGWSRWLTGGHHGMLRSLLTGQANAVLVGPRSRVLEHDRHVLNPRRVRRHHARSLGLGPRLRLAWARERRICQTVRVELPDGRTLVVVNIHASHLTEDTRIADAEILAAASFADDTAEPGEPVVFAGDFNVRITDSEALPALTRAGFSDPGPGIDHILVRGAETSPLRVWPDEERRVNERLLSDHAPVELRIL